VASECHVAQNGAAMAGRIISCSRSSIPKPWRRCRSGRSASWFITTLTKEALPMVRYRTRDITRLSNEPCACGRTHVRIMRVTGRADEHADHPSA